MKHKILSIFTLLTLIFSGCKTTQSLPKTEPKSISRNLSDSPVMTAEELYLYFMSQNPEADREMIIRLSKYYIEE
ncbi:MAG: muramidase, partial [Treponema sp.]|nr:muramidase [Treponema sp.]